MLGIVPFYNESIFSKLNVINLNFYIPFFQGVYQL